VEGKAKGSRLKADGGRRKAVENREKQVWWRGLAENLQAKNSGRESFLKCACGCGIYFEKMNPALNAFRRLSLFCAMKPGFLPTSLFLATALAFCLATETGQAAPNVVAWGNNGSLQANVPANVTNAVAAAGGANHSLALRSTGAVAGWGDNTRGEASAPVNLTTAAAIAAGDGFSLALQSNGIVVAWGNQTTVPATATNVVAIAASASNALALTYDGNVVSWVAGPTPPADATNIVAIAAGTKHSLALKGDGQVMAWGDNSEGQGSVPPGLTNVVALAAGKYHSLALKGDGTVAAWGDNTWNQTNVPAGLSRVVAISAGDFHCLALKQDGTVVAWGDNTFFQTNLPPGLTNVVGIASGSYHNLAAIGKGGPVITVQPVSQYDAGAENASFWVMAAGLAPLTYQWQQDGVNIDGATNSVLLLPGLATTAAGVFSVTVSNALGTVTSVGAQLPPVWRRPILLVQPQGQSVLCGDPATFQAAAKGPAQFPLSYQWLFWGTNLPGATNPVLSLASATGDSAGEYTVVVSNVNGPVTSQTAVLTVIGQPTLITSSLTAGGKQGKPFSYTITGLHNPTVFLATGLPDGLGLNTTNGLIQGTPLVSGLFDVILSTANLCASATTNLTLTITSSVPVITSALTASGEQAVFNYQIRATESPTSFGSANLPPGLNVNPATGVISGNAWYAGNYNATITASNVWGVGTTNLHLSIASSVPVITSALTATGAEQTAFNYQITANNSPTGYGAQNLPQSLILNPATGVISGYPLYAGTYAVTISASNIWGVATASLQIAITNTPVTGLAIANVMTNYSKPYLVNFQFSLWDNADPALAHAIVADPRLFSVTAFEDGVPVSPSETSVILQGVNQGVAAKVLKAYLALDFSESIASIPANGDTNNNGISDAVDTEVGAAQVLVNTQPADTQFGVYEFHRDDMAPQRVQSLTTDKTLLDSQIGGIWTNYVQNFPAGSRCWDALVPAIRSLGTNNADEVHVVIFCSDGNDTSSTNTFQDVINVASNANVQVYCVGFGDEINTTVLQAITDQTQGRYYEATNLTALANDFAAIGKDLSGQYFLRWATLNRSTTNAFLPSFQLTYQGITANSPTNPVLVGITNVAVLDTNGVPMTNNGVAVTTNQTTYTTIFIISPYRSSAFAGNVTVGSLRLVADAEVQPSSVTLRSTYVPRYIRQLRLHYRANWPCTVSLQSTNSGEQLYGWSLAQTSDGAGGQWATLTSSNQQVLASSIPFADFGPLLTFAFHDVINASNAFSIFALDNTIYTNTGNQSFGFENTNAFVKNYPVLPYGTPVPWLVGYGFVNSNNWVAVETNDFNGNGLLTWQDYVAGLNPTNTSSVFAVQNLSRTGLPGHYQITFNTVLNRTYRVETSTDLLTWQTLLDGIAGTGGAVTVSDNRLLPGATSTYYRAVVYIY
jgi:hypothetical protein